MTNKNVLVGQDADKDPGVPNSTIHNCEKCDREVWLAPSGVLTRTEKNCTLVCLACATELMDQQAAAGKKVKIGRITTQQKQEVIDSLLRERL